MRSVGIDIGTYSIKAVELTAHNKSIQLERFEVFKLNTESHSDRDIEILEILRNIHSQYVMDDDVIYVTGLPTTSVSLHRLSQPPAPRFRLLESLPFILADLTPLNPENSIYDFKILGVHPNGYKILAVAAKKENIEKKINCFKEAHVNPNILSVEGIALNNICEDIYKAPSKNSDLLDFEDLEENFEGSYSEANIKEFASGLAILDIGHQSSTLLIRDSKGLAEIREISFGGHHLAEFLCNQLGVHYKEALDMLQTQAILEIKQSASENELSRILKNSLAHLITDLKMSLLEIKGRYNIHVQTLHLVGGTSLLKNLGPYLTQHLQIVVNPIENIRRFPELNFKVEQNNPSNILGALGLALEGLRLPKSPALNLRKKEFAIKNKNLETFSRKWSYTLKLGVVAFLFSIVWGALRYQWATELADVAQDEMKRVGSQTTGLKRAQISPSRIKSFIKSANDHQEIIDQVKSLKDYKQASFYLRQLHKQAPPKSQLGMDINVLEINQKSMLIQGTVVSASQLPKLQEILKSLSQDGQVKEDDFVSKDSLKKGKNVSFSYRININPMEHLKEN